MTTATLPAWIPATRWMMRTEVAAAAWFWPIALVLAVVTLVSNNATIGVDASVVQYVRYAGPWFLFAVAVILATRDFAVHVASGLTRRAFLAAALAAGAAAAVAYAFLAAAGLVVEGAVFAANDWPHLSGDNSGFDPAAGFAATAGPLLLSSLAGHLSGLLVGAAYYRLGWRATLALPLTLAPIYLVGVGGTDTGQVRPFSLDLPDLPAAALGLAVLALGTLACRRLTRTMPVRNVGA
jgi:hypothetical protein